MSHYGKRFRAQHDAAGVLVTAETVGVKLDAIGKVLELGEHGAGLRERKCADISADWA
jgi:hypothetical protein